MTDDPWRNFRHRFPRYQDWGDEEFNDALMADGEFQDDLCTHEAERRELLEQLERDKDQKIKAAEELLAEIKRPKGVLDRQ